MKIISNRDLERENKPLTLPPRTERLFFFCLKKMWEQGKERRERAPKNGTRKSDEIWGAC